MRAIVFCLLFSLIMGCKLNPYGNFQLPSQKEYILIISEIINQDATFIKQSENLTLNSRLEKINIRMKILDCTTIPPVEEAYFDVFFNDLQEIGMTNIKDFEEDSLYFVFQNDSLKSISIDDGISKIPQYSAEANKNSPELNHKIPKLEFSIPVLNKNQDKAFVKAYFLGDYIISYKLNKVNNKWVLTNTQVQRVWSCG